jgi:hypothetical protein
MSLALRLRLSHGVRGCDWNGRCAPPVAVWPAPIDGEKAPRLASDFRGSLPLCPTVQCGGSMPQSGGCILT